MESTKFKIDNTLYTATKMGSVSIVSAEAIEEPNRENINGLIDKHAEKWDEKKGGLWFIEDFMVLNNLWFTDFRHDFIKVTTGLTPKKLADIEEVKKHLLAYFKPKLLKPGAKPKNTPKEAPQQIRPKIVAPQETTIRADHNAIVSNSKSKNEAMSRLRKAGYANKEIADIMKCKPGRVSSGIRSYDQAHATKGEPLKNIKKVPDLW